MDPDDEALWQMFGRRGLVPGRGEQRLHQHLREAQDRLGQMQDRVREMQEHAQRGPGASRGGGPGAGRRGRSLSRNEIVRAAVKVADAEGSEAISMRRIARELGAGVMSLYWHVGSKDELLDLMLDAVEGEQAVPAPTGDWRADLRALAVAQRSVLHRHRWLMDFIGGRPPLGPNTLRNLEQALAVIDGMGLDTLTALNVLGAVSTYVIGAVLREVREGQVERRDREALGREGEAELRAQLAAHAERLRATGRFPRFVRIFDEDIDPDAAETRDERFEFGLDRMLDGIAARLA